MVYNQGATEINSAISIMNNREVVALKIFEILIKERKLAKLSDAAASTLLVRAFELADGFILHAEETAKKSK